MEIEKGEKTRLGKRPEKIHDLSATRSLSFSFLLKDGKFLNSAKISGI